MQPANSMKGLSHTREVSTRWPRIERCTVCPERYNILLIEEDEVVGSFHGLHDAHEGGTVDLRLHLVYSEHGLNNVRLMRQPGY